MAKNRFLSFALAATVAGVTALSAGSAMAQKAQGSMHDGMMTQGQQLSMQQRAQMWNRDQYVNYQKAVQAQEFCRGELSEPAMSAIVSRIEAETGEPLSPGEKLTILDKAKWDIKEDLIANGCHTEKAKAALAIFDTKLATAAHAGAIAANPQ